MPDKKIILLNAEKKAAVKKDGDITLLPSGRIMVFKVRFPIKTDLQHYLSPRQMAGKK